MKYIKGLDSLRAFAVILVLIHHMIPRHKLLTVTGSLEQFLLPSGVFGVSLFFVLSGFLITRILLHAKESEIGKPTIIKNFIIRRALRIFPIYYLLIAILLLSNYPFTNGELPYLLSYCSNLYMWKHYMWSNFGHSWTLSVEEQFYLIWPWLIIFIHKKYLRHVFISFIIIGIVSSLLQYINNPFGYNNIETILTPSCFDAFGIGGLYAYLTFTGISEKVLRTWLIRFSIIAFAFSIYWKLCPYFNEPLRMYFLNRTTNSILSLSIIHLVILFSSQKRKSIILDNRFIIYLGKISYGIYLYHYPLVSIVQIPLTKIYYHFNQFSLFNNQYYVFIIKVSVTIIIASISFELIEKRFLNLKNKFNY